MQVDEPLDFNSAGPHESSAQAKIKQKTRQQRAQARIKRKKRAPGRPRPRPARASNKNKKKRAPATKTQKKGRPTRDYHAAPCKNHQMAKKKHCREESNSCLPSTTTSGRVALANQPSRCLCYYAPVPVFIRGKHGKITPNKSLFGKRNSVLNDL